MKTSLCLALAPACLVAIAVAAGCSSSSSNATTPTGTDSGATDSGGGTGTDGGVEASDNDAAAPSDASTGPGSDAGPITGTPAEDWTWVGFSDSKCRDGSPTGVAVNINPASTKVMMYLEGGGACFNAITCGANKSKFGAAEFAQWKNRTLAGLMDRKDAANPVKDWSFIYVPYCTGDVHAGNNPAGTVSGIADKQAFVGYANVGLYLKRIVPTFTNATQVLLTGISAGGFGAAANYVQVAQAFGSVPVDMLDDSGPLMQSPYVAQCLQDNFKSLWALDTTFISTCGADCATDPNFMLSYLKHVAKTYPSRKFGLMDSVADGTITNFFGFGAANCTNFAQVSEATFTAGLQDIRTQLSTSTNFGAYYFPGSDHTSLGSGVYDTRTVASTKLSDWVTAFVGGAVTNVGP